MKQFQILLVLLILVIPNTQPAYSGVNADGVLIFHTDDAIEYTSYVDYLGQSGIECGEDPLPCPPYDPSEPCDPTLANPTSSRSSEYSVFWVLAAFPDEACPRVMGVLFSLKYPGDADGLVITDFGMAGDLPLYLPNGDGEDWPASESGVALLFVSPRTSHLFELGWFAAYVYGPTSVQIWPHVTQGGPLFADDSQPTILDEIEELAIIGFGGIPGHNPYGDQPIYGACCLEGGTCLISTESTCQDSLDGDWLGPATGCDPNPCPRMFTRGDTDGSGDLDISDPIYSLAYQFVGGAPPPCLDAADDDDSGELDISDPIYSLSYQFGGGPAPLPPYPGCGLDETEDVLDCAAFDPCEDGFRPLQEPLAADVRDWGIFLDGAFSHDDRTLRVEVGLRAARSLLGFEGTFSYDPASLEFLGLEPDRSAESLQFLSATGDREPGRIHLGGVPDLGLNSPLDPGTHRLGRLVFRMQRPDATGATPDPGAQITLTGARFVLPDLQAVVMDGNSHGPGLPADVVDPEPRVDSDTHFETTAVLLPPSPNPTDGSVRLQFSLPDDGPVRLSIFDVAGREVRCLTEGELGAGSHSATWDGRTNGESPAPKGVYFARLWTKRGVESERLILVR